MVDIVHRIGIRAPASKVFAALSTIEGLSGWWTRDTRGDAHVGGRIAFRFRAPDGREVGGFDMLVLEASADHIVRWRVQAGAPEWVGTEIEFRLAPHGDLTIVRFGHRGWREEVEFTAHCSMKWATFLLSLRDLLETGRGRPAPADLKVDEWN